MTTALPFRARRAFRMLGRDVAAGEVVDVAALTPTRIRQLEASNYGMRVAAEEPDHSVSLAAVPDPPVSAAASTPPITDDDLAFAEELAAADDGSLMEVEAPPPSPSKPRKAPAKKSPRKSAGARKASTK